MGTQLCLAAAARALVDGAGRVLYVDAERSYQPRRLLALIGDALAARGRQAERPEELARAWRCTSRRVAEYAECLGELEGELLGARRRCSSSTRSPRLCARTGKNEFAERASALAEQATLFKRLAEARRGGARHQPGDADGRRRQGGGLDRAGPRQGRPPALGVPRQHVGARRQHALILQCAPTDALGPGGQLRVAKDASCADAVFEWAIPP